MLFIGHVLDGLIVGQDFSQNETGRGGGEFLLAVTLFTFKLNFVSRIESNNFLTSQPPFMHKLIRKNKCGVLVQKFELKVKIKYECKAHL